MIQTVFGPAALGEFGRVCSQAQRPAARGLREFAEAEITVVDGAYAGEPFRCATQPFCGLLYDELDSGRWWEATITGPSQSGKTLSAFVIPVLHTLFELREPTLVGLPDANMSGDKWAIDLKPSIVASRYAEYLPTRGPGSKGGSKLDRVDFLNGSLLRFMSAGGGDKSVAGFTARTLIVTETDGFDVVGGNSREGLKIDQLKARQRAYPRRRRRCIKECTVSTESGLTWREYQNESSRSVIVCNCPHCGAWVTPEREHLRGWQDARTELEAMDRGHFCCPACAAAFTIDQQQGMNRDARLVHKGQTIDEAGTIHGARPETRNLGFRWSAFNNLFLSPADHAADEWKSAQYGEQTEERIESDKALRQFVWAIPADDAVEDVADLTAAGLLTRANGYAPFVVPHDTLTIGIDIRATQIHWAAVSFDWDATGAVVGYGVLKCHSKRMGLEPAILTALRYFRDEVIQAGQFRTEDGAPRFPDSIWIDSNWQGETVTQFCNESDGLPGLDGVFWPIIGHGRGRAYEKVYAHPEKTGSHVKLIGPRFHLRLNRRLGRTQWVLCSDTAKEWTHARFSTPLDEAGALSIFTPATGDHQAYFRQITAERQGEEFIAGVGTVRVWRAVSRVNHWLDSTAYACIAARQLGIEPIAASAGTISGGYENTEPEAEAGLDWTEPGGGSIY